MTMVFVFVVAPGSISRSSQNNCYPAWGNGLQVGLGDENLQTKKKD
jgi:hypothetical protein